jgi:uncharacterized membrane protein
MRTRHIALLPILLLAMPAIADEKKADEKKVDVKAPVAKAKVTVKAGAITKVEPKKVEKVEPKKVEPKKVEAKKPADEPKAEPKKTEPVAPAASAPAAPAAKASAPSSQPVVVPPVDPDDVSAIIKQILASAKTGKWALLVGFIVMLLTWLVNKLLKQRIPSNVMPWLAIGLSTIAATAFALATGVDWLNALIVGFQQGLLAAGGWSAVGKYIPGLVKKPDAKPDEAKPDELKS